jgi:hypothetical protein
MRMRRFFLPLLLLALSACSFVDTEQVRVCRLVLPALHPEQSVIREMQRVGPLGREAVHCRCGTPVVLLKTRIPGLQRTTPLRFRAALRPGHESERFA